MSVSQETFDAAVRENVDEFGMEHEEAIEDAVKQFTAQGVTLFDIITDKRVDGSHNLTDKLKELKDLIMEKQLGNVENLNSVLKELETECQKGVPYRLLAGKSGLFDQLVSVLSLSEEEQVISQCVKTLSALTEGYPDILTDEGAKIVHSSLKDNSDSLELSHRLLKLLRNLCTKHEGNRKMMMIDIKIADTLVEILTKHASSVEVIVEVCKLLRSILSDDDIRVEFGQVQIYAKILVEEHKVIGLISQLLREHSSSKSSVPYLIHTLTKLAIRNEFCQEIVEHGGLTLTLDTLANCRDDKASVESSLRLITALAGNDDVKHEIGKVGGIPLIVMAIQRHQAVPSIAEVGCSALGALALRHPENSKLICEAFGHNILVDSMKVHAASPGVIGASARAIRNMVSREKGLAPLFLEQGVEDLLNQALKKHPARSDEVKGALRDLDCKVHLQEQWMGKTNPVLKEH